MPHTKHLYKNISSNSKQNTYCVNSIPPLKKKKHAMFVRWRGLTNNYIILRKKFYMLCTPNLLKETKIERERYERD